MNRQEQRSAFGKELAKLLNRFKDEFDMTYGDIVRELALSQIMLMDEASSLEEEEA